MSRKYIDVRITALSDADIKDILILLRKIQWCGEAGASRNIPINVDGDGSGYYDFNLIEDGEKIKNLNEIVKLDEEKLKKVSDGDDFETTYLGE
jgi:hypothetical protein